MNLSTCQANANVTVWFAVIERWVCANGAPSGALDVTMASTASVSISWTTSDHGSACVSIMMWTCRLELLVVVTMLERLMDTYKRRVPTV